MIATATNIYTLAIFALVMVSLLIAVAMICWAVLRHENKIGPLAKAQQEHEIEEFRAKAVLAHKESEAKMALAEAKVIQAQVQVAKARNEATQELMQ